MGGCAICAALLAMLSPWGLLLVLVLLAGCKVWYKATIGFCASTRRLDGKTVLVTGANSGIGLETARDLARRGARVLLACRDPQRGERARDEIIATSGNKDVEVRPLRLESLESVRQLAARLQREERRLDVLVNNAGAGGLGARRTEDGLHLGLQVNHLGHFLLTLLLADLLKRSAPSRVVFVSSIGHAWSSLRPEDLEWGRAKKMNDIAVYNNSKLANVLVARELARRLEGTGVTVNSLHPGVVNTGIFRTMPRLMRLFAYLVLRFFYKTPLEGAQTSIYLAVSEVVEGVTGRYFSDCKEVAPSARAQDSPLARKVWEKSEQLVGLRDSERVL